MTATSIVYFPILLTLNLPLAFETLLMALLYVASILWNRFGYTNAARIWMINSLNIGITIYALALGKDSHIYHGYFITLVLSSIILPSWEKNSSQSDLDIKKSS